ncbi:MAG: helix-turn-helix domain-containing protein [Saprospiraceae bacterium]|nr:helix-turn-helix domain-containing protein [Saprospiraceae bacterium]
MEIFHAEPGTPEDDELGVLLLLIKDDEDSTVKMPELDLLDVIKDKMKEQGLRNIDLEPIIGSRGHVSSILSGRREITLKMAQRLKDYFNLPAELFLHTA